MQIIDEFQGDSPRHLLEWETAGFRTLRDGTVNREIPKPIPEFEPSRPTIHLTVLSRLVIRQN